MNISDIVLNTVFFFPEDSKLESVGLPTAAFVVGSVFSFSVKLTNNAHGTHHTHNTKNPTTCRGSFTTRVKYRSHITLVATNAIADPIDEIEIKSTKG